MTEALPIATALTGPWLSARLLAHAAPHGRQLPTRCPVGAHRIGLVTGVIETYTTATRIRGVAQPRPGDLRRRVAGRLRHRNVLCGLGRAAANGSADVATAQQQRRDPHQRRDHQPGAGPAGQPVYPAQVIAPNDAIGLGDATPADAVDHRWAGPGFTRWSPRLTTRVLPGALTALAPVAADGSLPLVHRHAACHLAQRPGRPMASTPTPR